MMVSSFVISLNLMLSWLSLMPKLWLMLSKNPSYANTIVSLPFDDCRHLAAQIPHLSIKHIYRETNRCADRLANLGSCQAVDFISYSCPLVDLLPLVVANCQGMVVNRRCPKLLFSR